MTQLPQRPLEVGEPLERLDARGFQGATVMSPVAVLAAVYVFWA